MTSHGATTAAVSAAMAPKLNLSHPWKIYSNPKICQRRCLASPQSKAALCRRSYSTNVPNQPQTAATFQNRSSPQPLAIEFLSLQAQKRTPQSRQRHLRHLRLPIPNSSFLSPPFPKRTPKSSQHPNQIPHRYPPLHPCPPNLPATRPPHPHRLLLRLLTPCRRRNLPRQPRQYPPPLNLRYQVAAAAIPIVRSRLTRRLLFQNRLFLFQNRLQIRIVWVS